VRTRRLSEDQIRRGEELSALLQRRGGRTGRDRRSVAADLDGGERLLVLDHLIMAIGSLYAHLPAKRAAFASNPVQALTLLQGRAAELTDAEFHAEVSRIVTGLRDAHTRYIGPQRLHGHVAVLPFLLEQYGPLEAPSYLVTKINTAAVEDPEFLPGVRIESWNGAPVDRAVQVHAESETGGRADSRRSRALESLTFRAMDFRPPPDEDWVIVGYRTRTGRKAELRLPWRVVYPGEAWTAVESGSRSALRVAADPAAESVRRAKKLQFAPDQWASDRRPAPSAPAAAGPGEWLESELPDVLSAKQVSADVGYLRIWSFNIDDDDAFVTELVRLLALLPPTGLLIDVRANPGGLIWAAERALQLFTDAPIAPVRFAPVASPLMRRLADSPFSRMELEPWLSSLTDAVSTGEQYARPLPLTQPEWCNDVGRCFPGPVVVIADANTYSSGDIFCAGVVDHEIGPVVITNARATGAGGANVWTSQQLRDALAGLDDQLPPMPGGSAFTLAFRRIIRSGASDGIPLEDLGVSGIPYAMTRRDLLDGNADLLKFAAGLLNS